MDLYTASRRLSQSFPVVAGRRLPIGEHALIGDGYSCALVGTDGSIPWLCLPHFDSPSVFGAILDHERGGTFRVAPGEPGCHSRQAYDDSTNVLQTLFMKEGGAAVVTDFMPWTAEQHASLHELHRFIEVREGSMEIEVVFDPRFDYGRAETRVEVTEHGAVAESADGALLSVSISPGLRFEPRPQGGAVARFTMQRGRRVWVILSWGSKPEPTAAHRPFEHLRRTRRFWRGWASKIRYDGPWRHDVLRSALALKLLQFVPTGAMVAAPTTSLPVCPGGRRNWDYRFSWTRDSAMAIRAMNLIGYSEEALGFFHFVRDCVSRRGKLDLMVSIHGGDTAAEEILSHMSGHDGDGSVRIGNAASHQIQHDIIGPLLDAASLYERTGGVLSLRLWREIRHLIDEAVRTIDIPDHGIWEPRAEPSHHVHSKLMAWAALDRALALAPLFGGDREQSSWTRARESLRREILQRGYSDKAGSFTGDYEGDHVDASLLLIPLYGFLPATDPRVSQTVDRIIRELSDGPFLKRYRSDDGIGAEEGGFLLCGFWLAETLALAGRQEEALEVMHNHLGAANHVGLLAEEADGVTGAALGNFPQAFSHLGLIQAAARLDLALRLSDEGNEHPPRHAVDRSRT